MFTAKSKIHLLTLLGVSVLASAVSLGAVAQTDTTARQRVLDYLERQNTNQPADTITPSAPIGIVNSAPQETEPQEDGPQATTPSPPAMPAPSINALKAPVAEIVIQETAISEAESVEPEIIATAPAAQPDMPDIIATSPRLDLTPIERENSIVRDLSSTSALKIKTGPESFGFFTSARDYLAQRGQIPQPRLTLRYEVNRKNAKTAILGKSSTVDIIIGTDYAAISKTSDNLVIFDFKEKRLLNISKSEGTFTNASLYAAAYRNLDTVGRMTDGGKKRSVPLGPDTTLDAFYLESALGYSARPNPPSLSVMQTGEKITAELEGERVFSAMMSGPKLSDFRQAYSFIGLLYHSEPVHPAILADLKDLRTAPTSMIFHSFGPKIPDGEIISWTLQSKKSETAGFPLPASAKSVIELENVSPLGFVMSEAIAGRALGGHVDPRAALTVINQQLDRGDALSAWVSAQSLKDSVGGCEQLTGLCKAISTAERKKDSSSELTAIIEGLSLTKNKASRIDGLKRLRPTISAPDAPSLILRRAGLALAKTSPSDRAAAGLSKFEPADLLSQAIARNPYDLLAYKGLAQIQAARGDFIQSWDINDALRAFPNTPKGLSDSIERAESQLESQAPGFFPPVDG